MAAISDSSPLILFARIGRLELLRHLFDGVLIPAAVHAEVVLHAGRPGAAVVAAAPWILVRPVSPTSIDRRLEARLGRGETEAIALAVELGGSLPVLLDDGDARQEARRLGLTVMGCIGALESARAIGAIPRVLPVLDDLRAAGLYLSDAVYREVAKRTGEAGASP